MDKRTQAAWAFIMTICGAAGFTLSYFGWGSDPTEEFALGVLFTVVGAFWALWAAYKPPEE